MRIIDNLPEFVTQTAQMGELISAEQAVVDALGADAGAMAAELCVETITARTAGLWEDMLGFPRAEAWSMARRRDRIRARLMAAAPMTRALMEQTIKSAGGVDAEITEDADALCFKVKFTGQQGIPLYIEDIKREVERLRPYHLSVTYEYLYTPLKEYAAYALSELEKYTLAQIATGAPLAQPAS